MEATAGTRKVRFASIETVDALIEEFPFYAKSFIPVALYPNADNTADVPTYGVKATLVTSAKVPDDIVYAVTREMFESLDALRELHPALSVLTKENMLEGNSAPYHPGAMRYFREAGLMN